MDFFISKRCEYVIRAAIDLARAYPDRKVRKIRQIVADMEVPRSFASQIMADLIKANIVSSKAGKEGGYELNVDPSKITLSQLIRAGENDIDLSIDEKIHEMPLANASPVLARSIKQAVHSFMSVFDSVTLDDLMADYNTHEQLFDETICTTGEEAVTVVESCDLAVNFVSLREYFKGPDTRWVHSIAKQVREDDEDLYMRVGPGSRAWLGKTVSISVGQPNDSLEKVSIPIAWEARGASSLFPRLYAKLVVSKKTDENTSMILTGHYHPPLGKAGQILDQALLHLLAQATIKAFFERTNEVIEDNFIKQVVEVST